VSVDLAVLTDADPLEAVRCLSSPAY